VISKIVTCVLILLCSSCGSACADKAPPMDGLCKDKLRAVYEGKRLLNDQVCTWRGAIWDCEYARFTNSWTCKWEKDVPAETIK
jgi:hypothetical protein